jgi:hypothetical protein
MSLSFFFSATSLFVRHIDRESTGGARRPGRGPRDAPLGRLDLSTISIVRILVFPDRRSRVTAGMLVPQKFRKTAQERRFCDRFGRGDVTNDVKGQREIGHKLNVKIDNGFIE